MGPSVAPGSLFIIFDFFVINIGRSIIRPGLDFRAGPHVKAIHQVHDRDKENIFHVETFTQRYTAQKNIPSLSRYSYRDFGHLPAPSPWGRDRVLSGFRPRAALRSLGPVRCAPALPPPGAGCTVYCTTCVSPSPLLSIEVETLHCNGSVRCPTF